MINAKQSTRSRKEKGKVPEYCEWWNLLSCGVKASAGFRCEACGHRHDPKAGYTLTVHHLDRNSLNDDPDNLAALCQRCHLENERTLVLNQMLLDFMYPDYWLILHSKGGN